MHTSTRSGRAALSVLVAFVALLWSLAPGLALAANRGAWAANVSYVTGDFVTYSGKGYDCRQNHTSLTGWEPPNVPALWLENSTTPPQDTQAPSTPGGLTSPSKTANSVSLSWNASSDNVAVTGYEVFNGSTLAASVSGTSATVSGLNANTTYTFTVKARDAAGNRSAASSAFSTTTSPTAPADTQAPTAPSSLRSTGVSGNSVSLAWTGSSDNVAVTGYEVFTGSTLATTVTTTSATVSGLNANTTYTFSVKARDAAGNRSTASNSVSATTTSTPPSSSKKIIVGYWHNFDNGSTNIRLRDISTKYDVIQVAFAEPVGGADTGNMVFTPYNATQAEFKSDVAYLKSLGKKVLISIGGANGTIHLDNTTGKAKFLSTMQSIIDTYGFDGLDLDLEGSSLALNGGDTDFRSPTTPKIVNLIDATRQLINRYGSGFVLTMAPETAYVQGGYSAYGGPWGAYLPVIYALRDRLTYLHVQHYNTGTVTGLDGKSYAQGTPDFHVAMAEMMIRGFPVGGNTNQMFPGLRADQIVIGLPSSPQAAGGGYTTPANVQKALDYLIKGKSFGGSYVLRQASGYSDFKGLMTWSINWDKFTNFEFSNSHRAYLDTYK
ncbi:fibronectin type III domain-containing protein [Archangium primigenium]|uniref:fibronectin type III domain-containing protein n=1 Tax=[Archangium] primigenium TaxID=2792470 RepID=UPI00195B50D2|nr:glycosyl hydrolase family 18 protein [Archangium primigenium]MBM7119290.1 fibronectin type III domain-containing protein [Archangium primigenium]